MKFMVITDLPGMKNTKSYGEKQAIGEKVFDSLKPVARAKNARLGEHEILANGSLYLEIPSDALFPAVQAAVERANMKLKEMSAEDVFVERCMAMQEQPALSQSHQ
jgi:hypothetical protein